MIQRKFLQNALIGSVAVAFGGARILPGVNENGPVVKSAIAIMTGDTVVGIVALADLERLLRRQPSSAAYAVDVLSFPLPARGWLAGLLRASRGLPAAEADRALDRLPLRLAANLTRGQAEDLLARLVRERITARLAQVDGNQGRAGAAS